jgi:hypothetical protein
MSYENDTPGLAERYRPAKLADIAGQSSVVASLRGFLKNPTSCAMLFSGDPGLGKTSAAVAIAIELGMDIKYGECAGFHHCTTGRMKAEDVQELAVKLAHTHLFGSSWTVAIFDEADSMSAAAELEFRGLLEHLPPRTLCIFTTNEAGKLTPQFVQRCLHFRFASANTREGKEAAQGIINRIWAQERPGESVPTIFDLGIMPGCLKGYREYVQAAAIRLMNPEPFTPAPIRESIMDYAQRSTIPEPTAKRSPARVAAGRFTEPEQAAPQTPVEIVRAYEAKGFNASKELRDKYNGLTRADRHAAQDELAELQVA